MDDGLIDANSVLASEILQELSASRSDFAVITGFRRLPVCVKGDVDICCRDAHSLLSSLIKIINSLGGTIAHILLNNGSGFVISGAVASRGWATFRFDLYETPLLASNRTYPAKYLSEPGDVLLGNVELINGVYCVSRRLELEHYIKRKILKNQFDAEVLDYINILKIQVADFDDLIEGIFQNDALIYYRKYLNGADIESFEREVVVQSLKEALERLGKVIYDTRMVRLRRAVRKIFGQREGIHIAFAAPDGAGKTTVIDKIMQRGGVFGDILYFHLRPTLIPAVSAKSRTERENQEFKPHTNAPYSFPWSVFKYLALYADYTLGYYLKIFKKLYAPNLVISDRYFYDIFIDSKRFRLRGSPLFLNLFKFFTPTPDVCYALIGDPEELHRRKDDLSVNQIAEQNDKLNLLCSSRKEIVLIDANMNAEEVFNAVFVDLISRLNSKLKV